MQELDDTALLSRYVKDASEEAFGALVARHVDKVYSVALRHVGNRHQAEEITQRVFVVLARKSGALGKAVILEGWLYQTARRTSLAFMKSESQRARREQTAYMQTILDKTEPDVWTQIAPLLDGAIATLSEADRHAVVLRFMSGKSMKEIGAILGASEGAARLRLHRATEKLRQFFRQRGVVSTTELISGAMTAHVNHVAPAGLARSATAFALTSGPAAYGATATFVKIMASLKAKALTAAGALALLAAGTTPLIVKGIQAHLDARWRAARTTSATAAVKGQFFTLTQLVDAGNTTPEAAWESRYWARAMGDYQSVIAATDPQAMNTAKAWMGDKATFHARSQNEFAAFQGFQILARKNLSADKVELKYQFAFQDDSSRVETKIVQMVKVRGAWKCAQTRRYDEAWDADSQPEPES
ncbi:MAG TPA: sigma-70 family RNA polymerase sigma factor [Verrucomicrobiae bacterium]|jgi:RNA polymerase sigma factor (sigma-70 family)|nr:sigma-70 family RNA polymerase sigma factor [Verrucomicrobiae bacterium]